MRTLTTTEYNEVCKSYAQFGSKLFDEMFIGYDDNSVSYLYNEDYYEVKWNIFYVVQLRSFYITHPMQETQQVRYLDRVQIYSKPNKLIPVSNNEPTRITPNT